MEEGKEKLAKACISIGVKKDVILKLLDSGYFLLEASLYGMGNSEPCISDSFYGSKWGMGLTPITTFFEESYSQQFSMQNITTYEVSSLDEIRKILNSKRHSHFYCDGEGVMSFRGQTSEYFAKRKSPNPVMATDRGERLVIPSYWRQFKNNWGERFDATQPPSIFSTVLGDHLVYYGIPNWKTLGKRNYKRYGIHTMSDLEDLPDSDSQRYGRRWRKIKLEGIMSRDLPIVEQHYGIDTCGLDVTFDPSVACFFATHKFHQRDDGIAYYKVVEDDDHCGVLYGFVFRDPKLTKTSELVESLPLFDHIQPTRPQRQKCALPFFHSHSINEAVCDLDFVMYISKGFDISGLPSAQELFPGVSDDEFYRAALEIKAELNNGGIYEQFIEYKL